MSRWFHTNWPNWTGDVERDDMPGNKRGNFAMTPCAFFLRGTLGRVARAFFSDWGLGFGLLYTLTDLKVTYFTDLAELLLNFDGGIERSLELAEDEDVDDTEEVEEGKMKVK